MTKITRALISVSDKAGITEFARFLNEQNIEILSTGGTAKLLADNDIPVIEVSDYTQFPEMMDGRVKTLHPKIHGGILGRRGQDDEIMQQQGIGPIDLVIVNLYPFKQITADPDCTIDNAIENIDIGGPTMIRAAAKNYRHVTVVVDSNDYQKVMTEMSTANNSVSDNTRFQLAVKTFTHTADYDAAVSRYLTNALVESSDKYFPEQLSFSYSKVQDLRYGENPHQQAAFYKDPADTEASIANAQQIQGKELSFNNIADADSALECVKQFNTPACVIVKHANPCGVAISDNIGDAYEKAYSTDPTSAFGGIIAFNQTLDADTAKSIIDRQFVEVIIAPVISPAALAVIAAKKNIRLLQTGEWNTITNDRIELKLVTGGMLVQDRDYGMVEASDLKIVTQRKPSAEEIADLLFTWKVAKFVKSNAIVYGKNKMTIGVGAGQMSRVYSARIAAIKAADADLEVQGSVMASDAFFPFRDGLDSAAEVGITAVIQPGGSMRDDEVIAAADEHNIAMVFTGMRHFRH